jgi:hypothetical protein
MWKEAAYLEALFRYLDAEPRKTSKKKKIRNACRDMKL